MKPLLMGVFCLFLVTTPTALHAQDTALVRGAYLFSTTNVNLLQMRQTLGLNTVQATTGYGSVWDDSVLSNSENLSVYNQRSFLDHESRAQHMVYEAELSVDPDGIYNYFNEHVKGQPDNNGYWKATSGMDTQGWMVGSPWPSNEYNYGETSYTATFTLKIDPVYPTWRPVARCEVWVNSSRVNYVDLIVRDFTGSAPEDVALGFTVPSGLGMAVSQSTSSSGYLDGGVHQHRSGSGPMNPNPNVTVDLRVWWYGSVNTYLDKVTVDDTLSSRHLFAAVDDATIKASADSCASFTNHSRFYLADEPAISSFEAFRHVGDLIKDQLGAGEPKTGTLTASTYAFTRFASEAGPCQLMTDPYFIRNDTPHPSVRDATEAASYGFPAWNYSDYVTGVQGWLENNYMPSFKGVALAAQSSGKPWVVVPQLHGFFYQSKGKYEDPAGKHVPRPPAASEVRLAVNMGLVYGAKGYLAYPFGTQFLTMDNEPVALPGLVSDRITASGYRDDHSSNTSDLYGVTTWTGYKEKWDELTKINTRLKKLQDTLLAFNWLGTKSWSNTDDVTGTWEGLVTASSAEGYFGEDRQPSYAETGHFQRASNGKDYLVVLNRRSAPEDSLFLTLTVSKPSFGALKLTNIESGEAWTVASGSSFTDLFHASELKIYRVDPAIIVSVSGPETLDPGETGTFTATVTGGSTPFQYLWWFYDGCSAAPSASPLAPPCGQWNTTTIYGSTFPHQNETDFHIRCTVTDAAGLSDTSSSFEVSVGDLLAKKAEAESKEKETLPDRFDITAPYPNPFNPTTTITVALPKAATVRLVVFDVVGREVGRLASGVFDAGYHNYRWSGSNLASGLYLVRAEVSDKEGKVVLQTTHKLLLTK